MPVQRCPVAPFFEEEKGSAALHRLVEVVADAPVLGARRREHPLGECDQVGTPLRLRGQLPDDDEEAVRRLRRRSPFVARCRIDANVGRAVDHSRKACHEIVKVGGGRNVGVDRFLTGPLFEEHEDVAASGFLVTAVAHATVLGARRRIHPGGERNECVARVVFRGELPADQLQGMIVLSGVVNFVVSSFTSSSRCSSIAGIGLRSTLSMYWLYDEL